MALQFEYGVRQKVFVSHVADDGTFFVQLETEVAYGLAELSQNIDNLIGAQGRTPLVPEYGLKCFAFSTRDQTWYRALISEVNSSEVTVYYVDYGNTEQISVSNLNSPNDSLFESPYQAVCCSLSDFIPLKGGIQTLPDILLNQEYSGNFVSRGSEKHPYLSFLPCNNLTLFQDESSTESLAQQLVADRLGQFRVCTDDIKIGSRQKVYTCFHDSPGKFWVQLSNSLDKLKNIMEDLNDPNTVGRLKLLPADGLVPGVACCCQYSEDNRYYRVEIITKAKGPKKFKVSFVDYGNCEVVEQSDIKELPSRLAVPPFFAIQCCLDGVTPMKQDKPDPRHGSIAWNQKACDTFAVLTDDKELDAIFVSEFSPEIFDVKLIDTTESNMEIAYLLAQAGHATLSVEYSEPTAVLAEEYQYVNMDVGKTYKDVYITHAESPSVLWCQLPNQVAEFNVLVENLAESGPSLPPCTVTDVNQPCCVKYSVDESWCRGLISSIDNNSGMAQVFFVDYGNTETVNLCDIREPLPEFFSLPAQAVSFSMAEMSPIGSEWSQGAIKALQELAVEKSLTCEIVGLDEDGYPSAKLFNHLQQNMDIGLELIRQGHAKAPLGMAGKKSSPSQKVEPTQQSLSSNPDASKSHSSISSKGSDWSPFQSKKPSPSPIHSFASSEGKSWSRQRHPSNRSTSSDSSTRSHTMRSNFSARDDSGRSSFQGSRDQTHSTYSSSGYRRVRLQTGEAYVVSVCHVESFNEFYCQLHKNAVRLHDVMEKIERHCSSPNAKSVSSPSMDLPVLAKYSGDGVWYRATVKQVLSGKSCRVVFVDYGNSEDIPLNDLVEMPPSFLSLETQAVHCALIGVPRTFEPPESTIHTFGELTIDNDFKFSVKKFVRDKELNVGELLYEDGSSLIDHLKEKGLITTTSSSRGSSSFSSRESQKGFNKVSSPQSPKRSKPTQSVNVPLPQIPLNESIDVMSSFTGRPELFYLQLSESYLGLEQLSTDVNDFYSKVFDYEHKLSRPQVGNFCAAKFSEDGLWYRARVVKVITAKVEVLYIDYGNSETVSTSDLKVLQSQFMSQPCVAIPCTLAGLKTNSEEVVSKFVERITDCQLIAQFQQPLTSYDTPVSVKLFDTSIPDKDVNIADVLAAPSSVSSSKPSQKQADIQIAPVTPVMNSPMECLVCFVISPGEFYCQLSSETEPFDNLMNKLYAYYGEQEEGAALNSPVVGAYCAAPYSDGSWYRGRITSATDGRLSVYYIDYGNTGEVETRELRDLAPEFYSLPAQALKCQLIDLTPVSSQWNDAAIIKFQEFVQEGASPQVVFLSQLSMGCFEVQVTVEGKEAVQLLVEAGLARMQMSNEAATSSAHNLTIPPYQAAKGAKYNILVTFAHSPHEFYSQILDPEEKLDSLMTEIDGYCKDPSSVSPAHFLWKDGDFALAQFSDEMWYRAQIMKVLKSGTAFDVHYVDYGNNEVVPSSQLRPLKPQFCSLPCQVLKCRLNGSEVYTCTKENQDKFSSLILDQEFDIVCASVSSEYVCAVDMIRRDGSVDVMVQAIDEKILIPANLDPKLLPAVDKVKPQQSMANPKLIMVFPDEVTPDSFHDVTVSHVESPSLLFCQFSLYMQKHLELLMDSVQEYYTGVPGFTQSSFSSAKFEVGMFVAAQYSGDDLWYRAVVTAVQKSDVEVCFVDYGNRELVPFSKLRQLNPEFAKLPVQAIPCCLAEVAPVGGGGWSEEVTDKLFELVEGKSIVAQIKGVTDLSKTTFSFDNFEERLEISLIDSSIGIESELISRGLAIHVSPSPSPVPTQAAVVQETGNSTKTGLSFPMFSIGHTCEASVSHIDSPSSFWIQLPSADDDLGIFNDKLAAHYTSDRVDHLLSVSTVGSICCAKYSEDDSWYRGVIKSISSEGFEVCFVDYGNSEVIRSTDVKVLESEFQALPVQAIECKLYNCLPLPGTETWSDNAIGVFSHLVLDKDLSIKFVGKVNNVWEVEVNYEGGDVTSQLLHTGLVASLEKNEVSESLPEVTLPTMIPAVELQCGHTYPVYIAFNDSPTKFYCQLVSDSDKLEGLMAEIADFYNGNHLEPLIEVGAYCVAQYSGNSAWYRAKISSTDPKGGEIEVHFIDYGNSENVSPNKILALEARFANLPAQAFSCTLLPNTNDVQFAPDVLNAFFAIDLNQEFKIKVTGSAGEDYVVNLFDQSGFLINDTIIAICEGGEELNVSPPTQPLPPQAVTSGPPPLPPQPLPSLEPLQLVPEKAPRGKHEKLKYKQLEYRVGQTADVYISHVDSPTSFYCQPLELTADLDNMMSELGTFMRSGGSQVQLDPASLQPGQVCIARYSGDNEWYRAKIEGEVEGGILITFVDYGNCEVTTVENIAQIPPNFLSVFVQAIHCSVFDGLDASMEWSNERVAEFQSLIPENDHLTLKICGVSGVDRQYYVEISGNGEKMEFSSLLDQQVDQASASRLAHVDTNVSESQIFKPISQDVERTDIVQPATKTESESETGETEEESDTGSEGKPLIKAPFKLSLAVAQETVNVSVVYVQNPNLLYVQRVDCQPELVALTDEIEQYCASFGDMDQEFPQPFHRGDFVLAKFADDGMWYRAEVIGADSDGTAKVTFIDYGNEEIISPKDLMMCPENLLELPVQAIPCSLAKVPRRESWPSAYKELIDSIVTDKVLKATVELAAGQGMISIVSLEDSEASIDIAQRVLSKLQDEWEEVSSSDIIAEEPEEVETPDDVIPINDVVDEPPTSLSLPTQDLLQPGTTHEVNIISCLSPRSFVCQLTGTAEELEMITANLAELFAGEDVEEKFALKVPPREGDLVVAQFSDDGLWYRARVTNLCEDGRSYKVLFVDYGNSDIVAMENLRSLDPSLATHPPLAFECFLNGVEIPLESGESKGGSDVEQKAADEMMAIIGDESCSAEIVAVGSSGCLGVKLITSTTGKDIVSLLIEAKLVSETASQVTVREEGAVTEALENIVPGTELQPQPSEGESVSTIDDQEVQEVAAECVSLPKCPKLPLETTHEVYVVSCTSPLSFFCQLTDSADAVDSITAQLAELYSTERERLYSLKRTPKEGDFVVAMFSQDQQWCRATVSKCSVDGQSYEVMFVDYGNSETLPLDNIRNPDPSLATHPPLAFECFLNNFELLSSTDEVDIEQQAAEKMMEAIGDNQCTAEVVRVDDTGCLGVILRTHMDKKNVSSLLVEAKLGFVVAPVVSNSEAISESPPETNLSQEVPENIAVTESVALSPKVPTPTNDTPMDELPDGLTQLDTIPPNVVTPDDVRVPVETQHVSLPESQELQPATTHEVYIVSCASPHSFICQLAENSDALDSITTQLAKIYSKDGGGGSRLYSLKSLPKEGDFVVALFSQDEEWYRAVVTKSCDDEESCRVLFVDYGNSDTVAMENVRIPDPSLATQPPLAFECYLSGIEAPPGGEDELKKKAASAELMRLIGDQSCSMEILTVDDGGRLGVVLTTSTGVNVGSSLIAAKLASPLVPTPSTLQSEDSVIIIEDGSPSEAEDSGEPTAAPAGGNDQTRESEAPLAKTEDVEEPLPPATSIEAVEPKDNLSEIAMSLSKLTLEVGRRYSAEIVSVGTLEEFTCRITTRGEELRSLMDDLNNQGYRAGEEDALCVAVPQKGLPVAACLSKDNSWHRGEVLSLGSQSNTVNVRYVDLGDTETVSLDCVRHLQKRFADAIPTLCVTCGLPVLKENDLNSQEFAGEPWELEWPISSVKQFSQLTNPKTLEEGCGLYLEILDTSEDGFVVKVIKRLASGEELDVRGALIDKLREPKQVQLEFDCSGEVTDVMVTNKGSAIDEKEPSEDSDLQETFEEISATQQPTGSVHSVAVGDEAVPLHLRTPIPHSGDEGADSNECTGPEVTTTSYQKQLKSQDNCYGINDDQEKVGEVSVKLEPRDSVGSEEDEWLDASQDLDLTEPSTSDVLPDEVVPAVPASNDDVMGGSDSAVESEMVNGSGTGKAAEVKPCLESSGMEGVPLPQIVAFRGQHSQPNVYYTLLHVCIPCLVHSVYIWVFFQSMGHYFSIIP